MPASFVATKRSGGVGAPPGATKSPCQELADVLMLRYRPLAYLSALFDALPASGLLERNVNSGKRGPTPMRRRQMSMRLLSAVRGGVFRCATGLWPT